MNTVIVIDGGAGRAICAIPALEKYVLNNTKENIIILVYGWDTLFWNNPILQPLTFNINDKGIFTKFVKCADKVISPEPYRLPQYFNQEVSLSEAFDIIINGQTSQNIFPKIELSNSEVLNAKKIIADVKKYQKKEKTIVIQPFGSTARFESLDGHDEVVDDSARSMDLLMYSKMVRELSQNYNLILFAEQKFHFKEDELTYKFIGDLRGYSAVISQADYFVGCDSVGQHMARSFNKPGTVIFGSTFPENVSYPDWFQIIDKNKNSRVYSPLRMCETDSHLADRLNKNCMKYSEKEIDNIISLINQHIKLS